MHRHCKISIRTGILSLALAAALTVSDSLPMTANAAITNSKSSAEDLADAEVTLSHSETCNCSKAHASFTKRYAVTSVGSTIKLKASCKNMKNITYACNGICNPNDVLVDADGTFTAAAPGVYRVVAYGQCRTCGNEVYAISTVLVPEVMTEINHSNSDVYMYGDTIYMSPNSALPVHAYMRYNYNASLKAVVGNPAIVAVNSSQSVMDRGDPLEDVVYSEVIVSAKKPGITNLKVSASNNKKTKVSYKLVVQGLDVPANITAYRDRATFSVRAYGSTEPTFLKEQLKSLLQGGEIKNATISSVFSSDNDINLYQVTVDRGKKCSAATTIDLYDAFTGYGSSCTINWK